MVKPPVHWILDLMPLMALLLVSGFMLAFRQRREETLPARPMRKARSTRGEVSTISMGTEKFSGGAVSPRMPSTAEPFEAPDRGRAWDTLQMCLLRLVEQDERGGADIRELHRAVADYDSARSAARG
jgi:hypothetical protein